MYHDALNLKALKEYIEEKKVTLANKKAEIEEEYEYLNEMSKMIHQFLTLQKVDINKIQPSLENMQHPKLDLRKTISQYENTITEYEKKYTRDRKNNY